MAGIGERDRGGRSGGRAHAGWAAPTARCARPTWALLMLCCVGCQPGPPLIILDGSSTVYLISEAVAEEYHRSVPGARVLVGQSGTGGGFKRLIAGEIDICNASRAMAPEELAALRSQGRDVVALEVAYDGLAVVVHPENDWVNCLTATQLRELWRPRSAVQTWRDLNPTWPSEPVQLYGPGVDSGTFDYFTQAVVGTARACRDDFMASEDDNMLVRGVSQDRRALGFFGIAFYLENQDRLKLVGIDAGAGCVWPTAATVRGGQYRPLSRPLFIYVNRDALRRPEVARFLRFYLRSAGALASDVGYVALSPQALQRSRAALEAAIRAAAATAAPRGGSPLESARLGLRRGAGRADRSWLPG